MPITINPTFCSYDSDSVVLKGTLTFSGAYPVGGDTIDFSTVSGYQSPNGRIFVPSSPPYTCFIAGTGGDTFGFVPGTTIQNGKVIVNTASATVVSGNYGAEITGDANIEFEATFPKLL